MSESVTIYGVHYKWSPCEEVKNKGSRKSQVNGNTYHVLKARNPLLFTLPTSMHVNHYDSKVILPNIYHSKSTFYIYFHMIRSSIRIGFLTFQRQIFHYPTRNYISLCIQQTLSKHDSYFAHQSCKDTNQFAIISNHIVQER